MKKALIMLLPSLLLLVALVMPVFADGGQYGQYGQPGEQPTEKPREEVVHPTVEADLGDNLFAIAALVGGSAIVFYILSKVTARVYLMD